MSDNVERKRTLTFSVQPLFASLSRTRGRAEACSVHSGHSFESSLAKEITTKYAVHDQPAGRVRTAEPGMSERQGHSRASLPKTRGAVSRSVLGKVDWPTGSKPGSRCRGGSKVDDMHFVPDEVMAGPKAADHLIPSHTVNSLIRRSNK
ncbi:hypothetical protein NEUTE2DRAFT_126091 [Neurospora tetrasperma FGSC 2509]|nr:hypothetical protein NEUTE2DRAFT_126091 [Neurospora tetrasperma FGSC 2509]